MAELPKRVTTLVDRGRLYVRKQGVRGVLPALYRSAAHRLGHTRPRIRYVELSGYRDDPLGALEVSGRRTPVIEVSFERLRPYALSIPFSDLEQNPFTRTVLEYCTAGTNEYERSVLCEFYHRWQPATAGDVYGIQGRRSRHLEGPPTPDCLPWTDGAWPDHLEAGRRIHEQRMGELLGSELQPHGFRGFGPVSAAAGEMFFGDFVDLADSIAEQGYRADLGEQPTMELLTDGSQWAGRVLAGNHRCAVLAALRYPSFRIAVSRRVVCRRDSRRWHGVRSGLYTEEQALAVFDRFLSGQMPDPFAAA